MAAVGYDQENNIIYLLGGRYWPNTRYLVEYHLNSSDNSIISMTYGAGNFGNDLWFLNAGMYVQNNNILYMINKDNTMHQFHLQTKEFNYSFTTMPISTKPCVTTISLEHDYLILISGQNQDATQIYDITTSSWISSGAPYVNNPRYDADCAVVDQTVYLIAGDPSTFNRNIETLEVHDTTNLASYSWKIYPSTLTYGRKKPHVFTYGSDIVVVSGYEDLSQCCFTYDYASEVEVIDTVSGSIYIDGDSGVTRESGALIFTYPYIYIFGGLLYSPGCVHCSKDYQTYQYFKMELSV